MAISGSTDIEKENLEAHVELCAERYKQLETKLDSLEKRMDKLEEHVVFIRDHLAEAGSGQSKQLVTIGTTIIGVLITAIIGLITHLILKIKQLKVFLVMMAMVQVTLDYEVVFG